MNDKIEFEKERTKEINRLIRQRELQLANSMIDEVLNDVTNSQKTKDVMTGLRITILGLSGQNSDALDLAEKSLELTIDKLATDPKNVNLENYCDVLTGQIIELKSDLGDKQGALDLAEKSLKSTTNPKTCDVLTGQIIGLKSDLGDKQGALDLAEKSLELTIDKLATDPKNVNLQKNSDVLTGQIVELKFALGDKQGAFDLAENSLKLTIDKLATDPENVNLQKTFDIRTGQIKKIGNVVDGGDKVLSTLGMDNAEFELLFIQQFATSKNLALDLFDRYINGENINEDLKGLMNTENPDLTVRVLSLYKKFNDKINIKKELSALRDELPSDVYNALKMNNTFFNVLEKKRVIREYLSTYKPVIVGEPIVEIQTQTPTALQAIPEERSSIIAKMSPRARHKQFEEITELLESVTVHTKPEEEFIYNLIKTVQRHTRSVKIREKLRATKSVLKLVEESLNETKRIITNPYSGESMNIATKIPFQGR